MRRLELAFLLGLLDLVLKLVRICWIYTGPRPGALGALSSLVSWLFSLALWIYCGESASFCKRKLASPLTLSPLATVTG